MTSREAFLERVRQAVAEGNQAGATPPLPSRGKVGYQGAGSDPIARLREELTAAGGHLHVVADRASAIEAILRLVMEIAPGRLLLGSGPFVDELDLQSALKDLCEVTPVAALESAEDRPAFFAADVGISGVDHLVAETGTLSLASRRDQPRSLSLLVPIHIAVASREQITPDLFDLFTRLGTEPLPACLTLITGPSKTGDIELKLVTGVHGPGVVHVVVVG